MSEGTVVDDRQRVEALVGAALRGFGLEGSVVVQDGAEGGLDVAIECAEADALVGDGGETLDALQYLAARVVGRAADGSPRRVSVDADGYRARRAEALTRLAGRAADEAVEYDEEIELDPMSPIDRRTVHMALKDDDRVVTRSEGEEPRRRIIVEPAEGSADD